jgi:hypothetical protein
VQTLGPAQLSYYLLCQPLLLSVGHGLGTSEQLSELASRIGATIWIQSTSSRALNGSRCASACSGYSKKRWQREALPFSGGPKHIAEVVARRGYPLQGKAGTLLISLVIVKEEWEPWRYSPLFC